MVNAFVPNFDDYFIYANRLSIKKVVALLKAMNSKAQSCKSRLVTSSGAFHSN